MNAKPVYIGVDPAFRAGGFWACILDFQDNTVRFVAFRDLLHWHDWLRSNEAPEFAFVAIENSNAQNKSFDTRGNRGTLARKGRNVGTNQAVSQLAYESAVQRYGDSRVFSVSPKDKGSKYTLQQFALVARADGMTLPSGPIGQDKRDAYKLAAIARYRALVNRQKL